MGRDQTMLDLVPKHLLRWLGAHHNLVHEQKSTTMDFEFYLSLVPRLAGEEPGYEAISLTVWSCDIAVNTLWEISIRNGYTCPLAKYSTPTDARHLQWSRHLLLLCPGDSLYVKIYWSNGCKNCIGCCEDHKTFSAPRTVTKTTEQSCDDTHYQSTVKSGY